MDPETTLQWIDEFLVNRCTGDEVDQACEDLKQWLDRGGFEPHWDRYPLATSYYKCHLIQRK